MQIRGVITIPYAACCARVPSCTANLQKKSTRNPKQNHQDIQKNHQEIKNKKVTGGVITIPYAACCAAASTTRVPTCTSATRCLNKTFGDKKLIQLKQTFYSIDSLPSQARYICVRSEKSFNCDRWMS